MRLFRAHVWFISLARIVAGAVALALMSCTSLEKQLEISDGAGVRLESSKVSESTTNFVEVRDVFVTRAGLRGPPEPGSKQWVPFIHAGFGYVDEKCDAFLQALFLLDRQRKLVRGQAEILADSTRNIMGHVHAGAKALNVVGEAFGLARSSIDNYYNSMLYAMPPSTIQTMMRRIRKAHRDAIFRAPEPYLAQSPAMTAIANYLALCMPANIEARIENTINETEFLASGDGTIVTASIRAEANQAALGETEETLRRREQQNKQRGKFADAITEKSSQVTERPTNVPLVTGGLNDYERTAINVQMGAEIQTALCVLVNRELGAKTREAVLFFKDYWSKVTTEAKSSDTVGLLDREWTPRIRNSRTCAGYRTLYEKLWWAGRFGNSASQSNRDFALALGVLRTDMLAEVAAGRPLPQGLSIGDLSDGFIKSVNDARSVTDSVNDPVRKAFGLIARLRGLQQNELTEQVRSTINELRARAKKN